LLQKLVISGDSSKFSFRNFLKSSSIYAVFYICTSTCDFLSIESHLLIFFWKFKRGKTIHRKRMYRRFIKEVFTRDFIFSPVRVWRWQHHPHDGIVITYKTLPYFKETTRYYVPGNSHLQTAEFCFMWPVLSLSSPTSFLCITLKRLVKRQKLFPTRVLFSHCSQ
jgi:hypothetical protein